jgi:hypothetical protein
MGWWSADEAGYNGTDARKGKLEGNELGAR